MDKRRTPIRGAIIRQFPFERAVFEIANHIANHLTDDLSALLTNDLSGHFTDYEVSCRDPHKSN
jgi:hypothetical protein